MRNKQGRRCPRCGALVYEYKNPLPTVDVIIEVGDGIVLIERARPPHGWALPGGFVDYGESLEDAARREALEEVSLPVELVTQLGAYSDPKRDPRHHTISVVFVARARGEPRAGDDAARAGIFTRETIPAELAFDHRKIIADYFAWKLARERR